MIAHRRIINYMPHFFISSKDIKDGCININDKENYTHIVKSLRTKCGDKILFADENRIEYECVISDIDKTSIAAEIIKKYPSKNYLNFNLFLAQAPVKSDAQTLIIEKATELGVNGVYPIFTDNCIINKNVITQKIPKWQKIMYESSKQCERANVPTCFELTSIEKLIKSTKFNKKIVFCERIEDKTLGEYFCENKIQKDDNILVIIGPEGGFSAREFEFFKNNDIIMLSLGKLILKAETAVIVSLGNIVYEYSKQNSRKN